MRKPGTLSHAWHRAPRRHIVIMLTRWVKIGCGDGDVRRMMPGDIHMGEDRDGRGHVSRAVDGAERICLTKST
ncbi:MAG: hypothetical protein AAGF30_05075 [Pseudomonadota bacterium]